MQLVRGIMLCKRTERDAGKKVRPQDQNSADDQKDKLHPVGRQGAGRDRDLHFRRQRPGNGENRNDDEEFSAQHCQGQCQVEENRVGVKTGEGTAVSRRGRAISV